MCHVFRGIGITGSRDITMIDRVQRRPSPRGGWPCTARTLVVLTVLLDQVASIGYARAIVAPRPGDIIATGTPGVVGYGPLVHAGCPAGRGYWLPRQHPSSSLALTGGTSAHL